MTSNKKLLGSKLERKGMPCDVMTCVGVPNNKQKEIPNHEHMNRTHTASKSYVRAVGSL